MASNCTRNIVVLIWRRPQSWGQRQPTSSPIYECWLFFPPFSSGRGSLRDRRRTIIRAQWAVNRSIAILFSGLRAGQLLVIFFFLLVWFCTNPFENYAVSLVHVWIEFSLFVLIFDLVHMGSSFFGI